MVSREQVGLVRRDRTGKETAALAEITFATRQGEVTTSSISGEEERPFVSNE